MLAKTFANCREFSRRLHPFRKRFFEFPNFATGTNAIAEAVVAATEQNNAFSLIGGGDSASAVNNAGYGDRVSYVSTGGGALLEYMEGKTLPGVAALEA